MDQDAKRKALNKALKRIEKDFGKDAIMKLGDPSNMMNVETTPTGSLSLDLALGFGGIPKERIIEVYGPESSGKTTVALRMVAEMQKRDGIADLIDTRYVLDPAHAKNIGVDVDNLYISQSDTDGQALEITETVVWSDAVDIIIVNSVAAPVPKAEIEDDMGDLYVGLRTRLMNQALHKPTSIVNNMNSTVIFISQLYEKIDVMFGNPETTTGDRALRFYSSVRLDVRETDVLKQGSEIVGTRVRVKVVKGKIASPFKEIEFDIMFGRDISKEDDTLDLAVKENIVEKSSAWFFYEGNKIGQGRRNTKNFLHKHPALTAKIESRIHEAHGPTPVETGALPEGAEFILPLTGKRDAE